MTATSDKINTTSDGYQVSRVEIAPFGKFVGAILAIAGISAFYNKPGIYTTTIINVKIGDVTFGAVRETTETISGGFSNADFMKLKRTSGNRLISQSNTNNVYVAVGAKCPFGINFIKRYIK